MKIVCISGKAQHGKDTAAKLLEETLKAQGNRVLIAHYGDLVKYVCKTFFGWDGKKDEKGRTLLQRVGTDKIRAVSPDYWVDFIVSILDIFCDEWDYVLIPDTRFPNEYEIYETYGMDAILLRVVRPNFVSPLTEEQQKHASEVALDNYRYDATIVNSGNLENLKDAVNDFVNKNIKDVANVRPERDRNAPLTMIELRKMDGQPVWVVCDEGFDPLIFCALIEVQEESIFLTNNLGGRTEYATDVEFEDDSIKLYRYTPEERNRDPKADNSV